MFDIKLTLCLAFLLLTTILICISQKQHYWKIILGTSLTFFTIIAGKAILLILGLVILTYFFSLRKFSWWMVWILILPLLLKKIVLREYLFDELTSPQRYDNDVYVFLGLSYITFNAISYLIDIKRKYTEPERNFFKLLLYLTYFPIIFSGPLTRAKHFFGEIENIALKKDTIINGLRLLLWGIFKNWVVAGRLYLLMKDLLKMELAGPYYLVVGFVFFLFLYFSFSSLINIFQGISLIFNIRIPSNFNNRVYFSVSREQFWSGWHITLNNWFRDYFFYEIIRFDKKKKYINALLFLTFLSIALWHDFTMIFLVWGSLNALWLIAERKFKKNISIGRRFPFLGLIYHTIIASFLATIFISKNVSDIFGTLFNLSDLRFDYQSLLIPNTLIIVCMFFFVDFYERKTKHTRIDKYLAKQNIWHRYFFYYAVSILILFFMVDFKIVNYYNAF